ncbi:MAG: hypothetical protein JXB00_05930 [Bacteroidales bacterium]|nr:hypothetical protein [Bacteroidales bacterium]
MIDPHDPLYENIHKILGQKDPDKLGMVYDLAISDRNTLEDLLEGITSDDETLRYNCFKVLLSISEKVPLKLYTEWNTFYEMLLSSNAYHQMIGVKIIANLTLVDNEDKFEDIANEYFALLNGKSLITARYVASVAGIIAQAKPHLREFITKKLLTIDKTAHKNKDLIVFDAIDSFESFFGESENREQIISFVKKYLKSSSPKTSKKAGEFLKKHAA